SSTSTAASFPQRNYQIASASAWNHLVEVQGFGQRFIDASGTTAGTVTIHANAISRTITFSVPKSALGSPGPGWTFTVVLTGQDLLAGGAGLLLATRVPRLRETTAAQAAAGGDIQQFVSRPDLKPPTITVLRPAHGTAAGLVFLAPSSGPGHRGALIFDDLG